MSGQAKLLVRPGGAAALLIFFVGLLFAGQAAVGARAQAADLQFGGQGEGAGEFLEARGVAISQQSGDAYLADRNNARVDRFSAQGQFLSAWGWGVADGSQAFQTCTTACVPGIEGAGSGQFTFPEGVAIDNDQLSASDGDVYVVDTRDLRVEKFDAEGNFILMFGGEVNKTEDEAGGSTEAERNVCTAASGEECRPGTEGAGHGQFEGLGGTIAVDASGTVFVGDKERVQRFSEDGAFQSQLTFPAAGLVTALAVDSSSNIYVKLSEVPGVSEYDNAGTKIGGPLDAGGEPLALAIGPADELFVDDAQDESGNHHILEFSSAGTQVSSFDAGGVGGERGIAFGEAVGALYVIGARSVRIVPPPPPGPVIVEGSQTASEVTATGAELHATVNPEGEETHYVIEYGTSTAYESSTATAVLPASFEDQPVSQVVTGLQPGTTYHFRVVATNASSQTTDGPDEVFTTLPAVVIGAESASQVTAHSARLLAELNPLGLATTYQFEYGLTTAYEDRAPEPEASAGAGTNEESFGLVVEGLSPNTVYHFRVVARNTLGVVDGPDQTFSTEVAGSTLPDGRAWELVSPPDKKGVALESITEEGGVLQAAAEGNRMAYIAKAPIDSEPAGNRSLANTQLVAERGGSGWSTEDITTPHESVVGIIFGEPSEYQLFSDDLTQSVVEPAGSTPLSNATTERTPYRREANGEYDPLVTAANVFPGTKFGGTPPAFEDIPRFVDATPDLSQILLKAPQALTSGFESHALNSIYSWTDGALSLVSVLPNGQPAAAEEEEANLGGGGYLVRNALSSDGSRVVFEATSASQEHHLYMRDEATDETAQLDLSTVPGNQRLGTPHFQTASTDGSRVLFTDDARLTANSKAQPGVPDLYMCTMQLVAGHLACALSDLTVSINPGEAADVQGVVLGAGDDGERVFFVANGALSSGAAPGDCAPTGSGQLPAEGLTCNLYERDTVSGQTRLVAVLANRDQPDWEAPNGVDLGGVTSRVSPNGRFLAFMSQRPLTSYDNRDARSGIPDEEVYLYDAVAGELRCVSCDPSGARPTGILDSGEFPGLLVDRPGLWAKQSLAASIPGWTRVDVKHSIYQSRYLSNSGRLFFDSAVALVAQDANQTEDVYEYEPEGTGGCAQSLGCTALISSGASAEESAFLDASENGDDVFFLTSARLSAEDQDAAFDVYDAHVCSPSVPCPQAALSSPPPCSTAAECRGGATATQQAPAPPASQTPPPAGDVQPNLVPAKPKAKPLSRAQKLARALQACARKPKRRRAGCRAQARRRLGPVRRKTGPARRSKRRGG